MLVFTEATPNPNALKLTPQAGLPVAGRRAYRRNVDGGRSALADRLFELAGVEEVFVAADFVTVTRAADAEPWTTLRIRAVAVLADYLDEALPLPPAPEAGPAPASDLARRIERVLEQQVRPYVASHGGDVRVERYEAGTRTLWVRLEGACGGCPSARLTLKAGVERLVREAVPDVERVEEAGVAPPADGADAVRRPRGAVFTHLGRRIGGRREG